jgi:hypothetical protein
VVQDLSFLGFPDVVCIDKYLIEIRGWEIRPSPGLYKQRETDTQKKKTTHIRAPNVIKIHDASVRVTKGTTRFRPRHCDQRYIEEPREIQLLHGSFTIKTE